MIDDMMMKTLRVGCLGIAVLSICLGSSLVAQAQGKLVDRFESREFSASNGLKLGYRLLSPKKVEEGEKFPLVLFLHGAGERGDDNEKQLVHVAQELATDAMQQRHPCYVIAPQCPDGQRWVEVDWGLDSHKMPKEPSIPLAACFELLQAFQKHHPIDSRRIYICGLSMGGYGTWDALQRKGNAFAAAVPICGGGDPAFAAKIVDVPVWAFHGDADTVVKPHRSREMVDALQALGGDAIYTEYPKVGHNSWAITAENRLVWDWLFAQSKAESK